MVAGAPASIGGSGSTGGSTTAGGSSGGTPVAISVATGVEFTCALLSGGTVQCWGRNSFGELGAYSNEVCSASICSTTPLQVSGITTATAIAAGYAHACAVLSSGTVQCWGLNSNDQLGNGTTASSSEPVTVSGVSDAIAVATGWDYTCALLSGGTVQCWGNNKYGQLGNGTTASSPEPVTVLGVSGAIAVAAGRSHACALLTGGTVQCWGRNDYGQLGDGTTADSSVPVTVSGVSGATVVAPGWWEYTCALVAGGTVQCWGANDYGELGNGTRTNSLVPVTVSGITGAVAVTAGNENSCALLSGGTVQCWGICVGGHGTTTVGSWTCNLAPVQVSGITGATAVAAGGGQTCAVLSGGTVQCWGGNPDGELGNGTTSSSSVPVTVSGF
jgi:alpha-tubulin suppressor-like RCC1 family protein